MTSVLNEEAVPLVCCVAVDQKNAKNIKDLLDERNLLNKDFRLTKLGNKILLPITFKYVEGDVNKVLEGIFPFKILHVESSKLNKTKVSKPIARLKNICVEYLTGLHIKNDYIDALLKELPKKWDIHGDLLMFQDDIFKSEIWNNQEFWLKIASIFSVNRIALRSRISTDKFRTPVVTLRLGNDGWVRHLDNGIVYIFDVTKNMFSKGNITEKLRISNMDCRNQVVVDMFAGIGYFTLPYLVKAGANKVYACEWNPDAVDALKRGLMLNGVADRCEILQGDNRELAPENIADHVNLGLIPTSRLSWNAACRALKEETGGVLHIHENVTCVSSYINCSCKKVCLVNTIYKHQLSESKRASWCEHLCKCLLQIESYIGTSKKVTVDYIEYVKSYAPHIDHLVFDLIIRPL